MNIQWPFAIWHEE